MNPAGKVLGDPRTTDNNNNNMPDALPADECLEMEKIINEVYVTCSEFSSWSSSRLRQHKFSHIIYVVDRRTATDNTAAAALEMPALDPHEFECLELNFNSAMVLPNLYQSDKFIAKALKNDGKLLILEPAAACGGKNYQKCIAIILGYLMYHFELRFWDAYEALRKIYRPKLDLDRYLVIQLYEYEPILEVHRAAESTGHSRSGERLRSVLKRTRCALEHNTATSYDQQPPLRVLQATDYPDQLEEEADDGSLVQPNYRRQLDAPQQPIDETMIE